MITINELCFVDPAQDPDKKIFEGLFLASLMEIDSSSDINIHTKDDGDFLFPPWSYIRKFLFDQTYVEV